MKSYKKLKALNREDLKKKREDLYKDLIKDQTQIALGTMPKNPGKIHFTKKTIARINQILAQEGEIKT